jgi:dTDP-4-amino-4,6-dideoxygalactose transaminase
MTTLTMDRHEGRAVGYDVVARGFNYRIDEVRSALGMEQLKKLPAWLVRRRDIFSRYAEALKRRAPSVVVPFQEHMARGDEAGVHVMPVLLPPDIDRDAAMAALRSRGIQTSVHYRPVHTFTAFSDTDVKLPLSEALAARELTLPLYPAMRDEQIDWVVDALSEALSAA